MERASGRSATVAFMTSTSGADRVEGALAWLASRRGSDVLVVGASAEAADGLVRRATALGGATVGVHRTTLEGLALRLALRPLSRAGLVPLGTTALEAVAAHPEWDIMYAFTRNKGYGTKHHMTGLATHGAIPHVHRASFAPVARVHPGTWSRV